MSRQVLNLFILKNWASCRRKMKGAKGLYLVRTTPSSSQSLSSTDVAVAMKILGAKGPLCYSGSMVKKNKNYLTTHFLQTQMLVDILVLKEEKEVLCQ